MGITRHSGVVHQNVDRSKLGHGLLEKRRDAFLIGDVALPRPRTPTGVAHRLFERARLVFALAIRNAYGGAALDQQLGDASTDAARSARDDGDPAVEEEIS